MMEIHQISTRLQILNIKKEREKDTMSFNPVRKRVMELIYNNNLV